MRERRERKISRHWSEIAGKEGRRKERRRERDET